MGMPKYSEQSKEEFVKELEEILSVIPDKDDEESEEVV
jgi:hypothetical protein